MPWLIERLSHLELAIDGDTNSTEAAARDMCCCAAMLLQRPPLFFLFFLGGASGGYTDSGTDGLAHNAHWGRTCCPHVLLLCLDRLEARKASSRTMLSVHARHAINLLRDSAIRSAKCFVFRAHAIKTPSIRNGHPRSVELFSVTSFEKGSPKDAFAKVRQFDPTGERHLPRRSRLRALHEAMK